MRGSSPRSFFEPWSSVNHAPLAVSEGCRRILKYAQHIVLARLEAFKQIACFGAACPALACYALMGLLVDIRYPPPRETVDNDFATGGFRQAQTRAPLPRRQRLDASPA